jgi:hypothetical protein
MKIGAEIVVRTPIVEIDNNDPKYPYRILIGGGAIWIKNPDESKQYTVGDFLTIKGEIVDISNLIKMFIMINHY